MQHDVFEWWAYIWIPSLLGLATLLVSITALVASARATKIAHEVERQRELAAADRETEERKRRLLDMAGVEAKALHRYVVETLRPQHWGLGLLRSQSPQPAPRPPREQAKIDAQVMLEQSLVVGAEQLFDVTEYDITHRLDFLPEPIPYGKEGHEGREQERDAIVKRRIDRTFARIRRWGLDPDVTAAEIVLELRVAETNPEAYWKGV